MSKQQTHQNDIELLGAAAAGDAAARRAFGERLSCVPAMLRSLNRRMGLPLQQDELDDVVQEVAAAVWRKIESFRGNGSLESWLYQFSSLELLRFLDRRRRRQNRVQLTETLEDHSVKQPEPNSVRFDHVYRGLAELSPNEQEVLRAKFFEHLTFEEVAERLGISPNTVKTRYYRSIQRLAVLLRPDEEERA